MGNVVASSSSASSSSALPPQKYDVFMSFRGEDTRSNITSHLYTALSQKGIKTYIDDNELPRGDDINHSLMRAIEDSSISLVVFSENYATSKWCLNELVKIIDCKSDEGQVIPVFFKVDPSHVRYQKGTFKDAFDKHERDSRHDQQILNNWRHALSKTASLSGCDLKNYRNESEFIGDIVKVVLQKLKRVRYPTRSTGLVGMDENCDSVKMLLKEAQIIGIWGMGGIGKTTMARAVFNELFPEFEDCCFLENIRENSERRGLEYLRDKLLLELRLKEPEYAIGRLSTKKVLIVLDDVSNSRELEYLARGYAGMGQGSKVIITTRDMKVLSGIVDIDEIYEAKALSYQKSLQLFNHKAFHKDNSETGYEELAIKAVDYAKGIPLALEVLGSFLYSRSIEEWKDALARLVKTPNQDIHRVLKLSFDGLSDDVKEMFLDIAFFFKGQAEDDVIRLLKAFDFHETIGLGILVEKALIRIVGGIVWMHDLIQEMGWEIVRKESMKEPGKRSRLRDPKDIYFVLKNNTGSDWIEGIMLDLSQLRDICLNADPFKKMIKLRFLKFYDGRSSNCNLNLPFGLESLPNALKYFQWDNYPLNSLPSTFNPENLVQLKMPDSQLKKLWDGIQNFVNLKSIDLGGSEQLTELPDFSKAQNLEEVYLAGCTSLCYVHSSILSLHKLVDLYLFGCRKLKELKSQTHLESLTYLLVSECSSLTEFSLSSKKMENLWLYDASVEILGSSIGRLCKLRWLYIDGSRLKKLPVNELRCLRSLEHLRLVNCKLVIEKQELHILFEALRQSLRRLYLEGCCNITELPDNMKHLSRLEHIDLTNCRRLQSIPELPPSTGSVDATDCTSLDSAFLLTTSIPQPKYMVRSLLLKNCLELNESSLSRIEDYAYFSMKRAAYINTPGAFCYPGSRLPKLFRFNQTKEASCSINMTVNLSSGFMSNLLDFAFCCVIPQSSLKQNSQSNLGVQSYFNGVKFSSRGYDWMFNIRYLKSDHVFIWSDTYRIKVDLKKFLTRQRYEAGSDSPTLSFTLNLDRSTSTDENQLLCGVCPIYASEYHDFCQQMKEEFKRGLKINRSGAIHELSLDDVMKYAHFSLNPAKCGNLKTNVVSHPQHVIPDWFTNKGLPSWNSSMSIELYPDVDCLLGFVFCFFIPHFSLEVQKKSESSCHWSITYDQFIDYVEDDDFYYNGELEGWHYSMKEWNNSKNVFIWYDPLFSEFMINKFRVLVGTIAEGTSRRRLTFQFWFGESLIKECGVHPVYASEYTDFLYRQRCLESNHEEQQLDPTQSIDELN